MSTKAAGSLMAGGSAPTAVWSSGRHCAKDRDAERQTTRRALQRAAAEKERAPEEAVRPGPCIVSVQCLWPHASCRNRAAGTLWGPRCGPAVPEGKIENGEVMVHQGRIVAVGKELDPQPSLERIGPALTRIDAAGKHLTPGILDEHTHIAASRGINEGTQASSAEVSVGTVVNSEDVNLYRHLAGGSPQDRFCTARPTHWGPERHHQVPLGHDARGDVDRRRRPLHQVRLGRECQAIQLGRPPDGALSADPDGGGASVLRPFPPRP